MTRKYCGRGSRPLWCSVMAPDPFRTLTLCDRSDGKPCDVRLRLRSDGQAPDASDPTARPDTDAQQNPHHVVLPASALIVIRCACASEAGAARASGAERLVFSLAEVAWMTGFSERGIERDCRGGKVRHVHRGQSRGMTREQIDELIAVYTSQPQHPASPLTEEQSSVAAAAERTRRRLRGRR